MSVPDAAPSARDTSTSAAPVDAGRHRDVDVVRDGGSCCNGSGYRVDGSDCTCDARPFRPETPGAQCPSKGRNDGIRHQPPELRPAISRSEWEREQVLILADGHELTRRIDDLLKWSSDTLGSLVSMGELTVFMATGGPPELVAGDVVRRLDELEEGLAVLPAVLAELGDAAWRLCPDCQEAA